MAGKTQYDAEPMEVEGGDGSSPQDLNMSRYIPGVGRINMASNKVGQAFIDRKGPTSMDYSTKEYDPRAIKAKYNISGGNFSQANIGGTAHYNNRNSKIGGANSGGGFQKDNAELLTKLILDKGVSRQNFINLLEKNYSLAQIAFSMPEDRALQDRMITAMLLD